MATRDIADALQTQLDHSDEHSISAFAANNDLSAKLTECELKLKDALIEVGVTDLIFELFVVLLCHLNDYILAYLYMDQIIDSREFTYVHNSV